MLYPSWNGKEIKDMIAPWGTVLKSDENYNQQIIDELSDREKKADKLCNDGISKTFWL